MEQEPLIHPFYLPVTASQLRHHFAPVRGRTPEQWERHLQRYLTSAHRYTAFCAAYPKRDGYSMRFLKDDCQTEKDERFWAAACWLTLFYHPARVSVLAQVMTSCLGDHPPIEGLETWEECFTGRLHLFFEAYLPSPRSYKEWLAQHLRERHIIPHVLAAAARGGTNFEGPTHVDVLLLNEDNGFSLLIEAKVLSDLDDEITFDLLRNQLARYIDVAQEHNTRLSQPLRSRRPDRTIVLLHTPALFKQNPTTRLYGWLYHAYKNDSTAHQRDFPHRTELDWASMIRRLGWLTYEDCQRVLPEACAWLPTNISAATTA